MYFYSLRTQLTVDMTRSYKSSKILVSGIKVNVKQNLVCIIMPIFAAHIRGVPPPSSIALVHKNFIRNTPVVVANTINTNVHNQNRLILQ
jgi:hypothetical protein